MGGLTKEWFQLLVKQIFEPDYGMFVYHPNSRCYWFSVSGSNKNLREYNLIGVLMGLAVYNRYISYSVLNISPQNVSVTKKISSTLHTTIISASFWICIFLQFVIGNYWLLLWYQPMMTPQLELPPIQVWMIWQKSCQKWRTLWKKYWTIKEMFVKTCYCPSKVFFYGYWIGIL